MEDYDAELDFYGGEGDYEDDGIEIYSENNSPIREGSNIADVYFGCLEPTIIDAFNQITSVLCACLLLRLLNQHVNAAPGFHHFLSALLGLIALFSIVGSSAILTLILGVVGYLGVYFCSKRNGIGHPQILTFILLGYLVAREYSGIIRGNWEQVKGIQMIMIMKISSLCFDMSIDCDSPILRFEEYLGYIFCPANVIFGPWIPFDVYCRIFEKKNSGLRWIIPACWTCVWSFISLGISSCMVYWIFQHLFGSESRWILTIRDAMSVRFSHYFISFLSEFCCLLCGYGDDLTVAEPYNIEFPRSLEKVVVSWNIPMHQWLKIYIYRPSVALGKFRAVFLVFMVSSMLHGFNFGLTSVLLSLGCYAYVEGTLRGKLSAIFDACIRSRKCRKNCSHKHKADNVFVVFVNFIFGFLAFFNLAYLGVMISKTHVESEVSPSFLESINEDVRKWSDLHFTSHLVMIVVYLASISI